MYTYLRRKWRIWLDNGGGKDDADAEDVDGLIDDLTWPTAMSLHRFNSRSGGGVAGMRTVLHTHRCMYAGIRVSTYRDPVTTLFIQTGRPASDTDQHPLMTSKWPFVDKHFLFFQWNAFNVYIDRCIFWSLVIAHTPSTLWTPSFQEHFRYKEKPKTWKKPMG